MDLDHPRVADEHHDRLAAFRGLFEHVAQRMRGFDRICVARIGEAQRLHAAHAEALRDAEELVRVGHRVPRGAKARDVDLGVGALGRFRCGGRDLEARLLRRRAPAFDERVVCGVIAVRAQVDLVDRVTLRIEELQALQRAVRGLVAHRERRHPVTIEDAQVDVAEREPDRAIVAHLRVLAVLFVDGRVVARQRHHAAEARHFLEHRRKARVEPHDVLADERGERLAFADAERLRDVAVAQLTLGLELDERVAQRGGRAGRRGRLTGKGGLHHVGRLRVTVGVGARATRIRNPLSC
ncbi:uncharacterized protein BCN122_II3066 [Burkholderia cenocepacia]|nr:uncharacterized protein BCN122_II3066 [Burkholderia cenocepacia]